MSASEGEITQFSSPSIVDLLKADLHDLEESKDVIIPIKGWERTGLAAKYKLPESGKELDIIARSVMRDQKDQYSRNFHIAARTMIALNEGLYVCPPGVEDYVELDPQESGVPISFKDGPRLCEVFGLPIDLPPTVALKRIFGNNEMALMTHAERLSRWMADTKVDLSLELWQLAEL